MDRHPKDFDIATDARPDEIRALFGNCRLIGRRFRLAHVRFGREIIEVVTFRAAATEEHKHRKHAESGRILRDNVYGTIEEDIWRRDFTINALYYNIDDFTVWDYTSGMEDISKRTLRRDVEIFRMTVQKEVTNTSAHQKRLVAGVIQPIEHLDGVVGDVRPADVVSGARDDVRARMRLRVRVVQSGSVGEFNRSAKPSIIAASPIPGTRAPFV